METYPGITVISATLVLTTLAGRSCRSVFSSEGRKMKLRMLAMATVAAAALSTPAMAGDGWYLGLGGGWDNQVGYRVKSTAGALAGGGAKINSQDSAIGVVSVGYKWAEGWRLENEFSFTQHDTSLNGTGAFNATGGNQITADMINLT